LNSNRRVVLVVLIVVLLGASATTALYLLSRGGGSGSRPLPAGCAKPVGGFLIVASNTGYNDSIAHGAPTKSWPIITVHQGQNVTIVVCNTDVQAHGFQITHYFVKNQATLVPGQKLRVSFIADQTGSFDIYCDIFCSIHIYMQNGLLNVTA
jgi:hypothetical protein